MKYLTYLKPSQKLFNEFIKREDIMKPSSGYHCTLLRFFMDEENEKNLVEVLSRIKFNPFFVECENYDKFDSDSVVLKIKNNINLANLHYQIVEHARPFDKNEVLFNEMVKMYGIINYNPHFTLSKDPEKFNFENSLEGITVPVYVFYLSKKKDEIWKGVTEFNAVD